jgi:hypothetical protein
MFNLIQWFGVYGADLSQNCYISDFRSQTKVRFTFKIGAPKGNIYG